MSGVAWGPEIAVNGKRPEWLTQADVIDWRWSAEGDWHATQFDHYARGLPASHVSIENGAYAIRLRADHPHYTRNVTPTQQDAISGEVVERQRDALTWIADFAASKRRGTDDWFDLTEIEQVARRALLPEPVDRDLIAAREAEAKASEANGFSDYAAKVRAGGDDNGPVRLRYEGIKLGRALADGERA